MGDTIYIVVVGEEETKEKEGQEGQDKAMMNDRHMVIYVCMV